MKIRAGFVSNSSSTCFILKFDKEVQEYNLEKRDILIDSFQY